MRRWLRGIAIGLAGLLSGFGLYWAWSEGRAGQPYPFNHDRHRAMACAACHLGVETGTAAGLPGGEVCARCHATSPLSGPAMERAWAQTVEGQAPWGRLYQVPAHVYFSHRRHVALVRIDCAACHGDMGGQARPPSRPLSAVSMEQCIACHRRDRVSDDCAACHR